MAFISEIHYRNNHANATGIDEYVEVVLTAAEYANASDYDVVFYNANGSEGEGYNLGNYVVGGSYGNVEVTLSDGLYVFLIEENMALTGNNSGNYTGVALAENSTVLDFYDIAGGSTLVPQAGTIAAGETPVVLPFSSTNAIQIDSQGNISNETSSPGHRHMYVLCGELAF